MALVVKDRVQETTVTVGTIAFVLAGAVSGFQSFSVIGNGNTTYYAVVGGTEWEVGIGTYTALGTVLSRDTILESSNGGTAVNFSAGTKNVFVTYPAEKGLYLDASGNAIALGTPASVTLTNATGLPLSTGVTGTLPIANGGTGTTSTTFTNLTTNVTGTLPVANGGTGQTSYTDGQLLIGNTTGNTLTKSTLTAGTGVSVTNASGAITIANIAPSISWQSVQTTGFTAVSGSGYPCNTTSAAFTVTLPASPSAGNIISILDYAGTFSTNNLTINPNGLKLQGSTANSTLNTKRQAINLVYVDATQGWVGYADIYSTTSPLPQSYTASYLIVAGGGGGGSTTGGGGGAGGYLTGTTTIVPGTVYTAVVGGGGNGGTTPASGTQGSSSTFTGLTTAVGGGGGGGNGTPAGVGGNGGSGGGAGWGSNPAGTGTPGQGNNGGAGFSSPFIGGGGGGASAVGTGGGPASGGNGGSGTANSITGTSVYYAGGGGAGYYISTPAGAGTPSTGGGGGGGTPASNTGVAGTANSGGGGGGGGVPAAPQAGGAGGSGVVILSVPTANYSGTTTGSPTITTSGSNTIIKYTSGSGTYTG